MITTEENEVTNERVFEGMRGEIWADWTQGFGIVKPDRGSEVRLRLQEILDGERLVTEKELVQILILGEKNAVFNCKPWDGYYIAENCSESHLDKEKRPRFALLKKAIEQGKSTEELLRIVMNVDTLPSFLF